LCALSTMHTIKNSLFATIIHLAKDNLMRKILYKSLLPILLLGIIGPVSVQAQNNANVTLRVVDVGLSQYQAVYLADLDFLQVGSSQELFKVVLSKDTGAIRDAVIRFDFNLDGKSIAYAQTKPFVLPEAPGSWPFSNKDLSQGYFIKDEKIEIAESGVSEVADNIKSEIFASSQLPVGSYVLVSRISFTDVNNTPGESVDTQVFTISNPSMLNLVSPGVVLNSGFKYEVYTDQPLFQWNGNSGEYEVVVFKKESEFNSAEDILNSEEIWNSGRISSLSVQYPTASAYPLEFGQTYVWLVKSFIKTSAGENAVNSELWEFTLQDPSKAAQTEQGVAKQELESLLRQLMGDDADGVIRQIDDLNLKTIRVNGSTISVKELYDYLEKYRNEKHQISDLLIR